MKILRITPVILLCISNQAAAITLDEAITSVQKQQNVHEVVLEDLSYKSDIASAKQTVDQFLPNPYLFYNYTKPGDPRFASPLPQVNEGFPTRFVTGLVQKNYGIAVDYNILSLPQLIKKVQSINVAKAAAFTSTEHKKNEFFYILAQTYIELYRTEATLNLQKKIFEAAKGRHEELKTLFAYGRVSKSDMLRAYSDFLTSKMNVEKYQILFKEAQERYKVKFLVLHTDLSLPEASLSDIAPNLQTLKEQVKNNYAIQNANYTAQSYKNESQINKLALLPKITVGYRYALTQPDYHLSIPNYKQGTFIINATIDLLNITNYIGGRKYTIEEQKKKTEAKILTKNYIAEVEALWNDTKYQEELIEILSQVVKNAKEAHAITKQEVRSGTKSFTDELLAKQEYTMAELNLLEAKLKKVENIHRLKFLISKR